MAPSSSTASRSPDSRRGGAQNLGYVPQDTYILDESLLQNVAFLVPDDESEPRSSTLGSAAAQLTDVIESLPDGVDAQVGERGAMISGGQRQRLGIARALYREPRLLVLDEATSALDNETEHKISQAVRTLGGTVSVIVVAHRLSTVRQR